MSGYGGKGVYHPCNGPFSRTAWLEDIARAGHLRNQVTMPQPPCAHGGWPEDQPKLHNAARQLGLSQRFK